MEFEAVFLARRPGADNPVSADCFQLQRVSRLRDCFTVMESADGALVVDPPLPPGCVVVETEYLSVDPYMRCRFNEDTGVDYTTPFEVGAPLTSAGVGKVRISTIPSLPVGTHCGGDTFDWQWQRFNLFGPFGDHAAGAAAALPMPIPEGIAAVGPSHMLGALGVTGLTAFFGIMREAALDNGPKDVLVVSSAAGGTGIIACQLAKKFRGARVIGLAGTDAKCAELLALGAVDAAINYKSALSHGSASTLSGRIADAVHQLGASGVTHYFDSVGGTISDAVLATMAPGGQVVLCGQISSYDRDLPYPPPLSAEAQRHIDEKRLRRERFLVLKYASEFPEAVGRLAEAVLGGKLVARETVVEGIRNLPAAFLGVMSGTNVGKMVVKL